MNQVVESSEGLGNAEVDRLAGIIMVLQRCFIQRLSEHLVHGQVSFPQYFLLTHAAMEGSLTMSQIAERMNHSTAAATGLVDRLENLGYVRRVPAQDDRRKVFAEITPKGRTLVATIREDVVKNLHIFIQILSPAEQSAWLSVYEKLHDFCLNNKLEDPSSCQNSPS